MLKDELRKEASILLVGLFRSFINARMYEITMVSPQSIVSRLNLKTNWFPPPVGIKTTPPPKTCRSIILPQWLKPSYPKHFNTVLYSLK
jgi:hypothetical protein